MCLININFIFLFCLIVLNLFLVNSWKPFYNFEKTKPDMRITLGGILNCPQFKQRIPNNIQETPEEIVKIAKQEIKVHNPLPLKIYSPYVPKLTSQPSTERPKLIKPTIPINFVPRTTTELFYREVYTTPTTTPPYTTTMEVSIDKINFLASATTANYNDADAIASNLRNSSATSSTDSVLPENYYNIEFTTPNYANLITMNPLDSTSTTTDATTADSSVVNSIDSTTIQSFYNSELTTASFLNFLTTTSADSTVSSVANSSDATTPESYYNTEFTTPSLVDSTTTNSPDSTASERYIDAESTTADLNEFTAINSPDSTTPDNYYNTKFTTPSWVDSTTTYSADSTTTDSYNDAEITTTNLTVSSVVNSSDATTTESYYNTEFTTPNSVDSTTTNSPDSTTTDSYNDVESTTTELEESTAINSSDLTTSESYYNTEYTTPSLADSTTTNLPDSTTPNILGSHIYNIEYATTNLPDSITTAEAPDSTEQNSFSLGNLISMNSAYSTTKESHSNIKLTTSNAGDSTITNSIDSTSESSIEVQTATIVVDPPLSIEDITGRPSLLPATVDILESTTNIYNSVIEQSTEIISHIKPLDIVVDRTDATDLTADNDVEDIFSSPISALINFPSEAKISILNGLSANASRQPSNMDIMSNISDIANATTENPTVIPMTTKYGSKSYETTTSRFVEPETTQYDESIREKATDSTLIKTEKLASNLVSENFKPKKITYSTDVMPVLDDLFLE